MRVKSGGWHVLEAAGMAAGVAFWCGCAQEHALTYPDGAEEHEVFERRADEKVERLVALQDELGPRRGGDAPRLRVAVRQRAGTGSPGSWGVGREPGHPACLRVTVDAVVPGRATQVGKGSGWRGAP